MHLPSLLPYLLGIIYLTANNPFHVFLTATFRVTRRHSPCAYYTTKRSCFNTYYFDSAIPNCQPSSAVKANSWGKRSISNNKATHSAFVFRSIFHARYNHRILRQHRSLDSRPSLWHLHSCFPSATVAISTVLTVQTTRIGGGAVYVFHK